MYTIDKKKIFWKKIQDETVLINIDTGCYYSFNKIGSEIWEGILRNRQKAEIVENISENYDEEKKVVEADVNRILGILEKENLVKIK